MEEKIQKKVFVFKIIAFELGAANSPDPEEDTCHRQWMCQQTPLGFCISLRDIFSKSVPIRVMKKHEKSTLMEISQVFGTL